MGWQNGMLKWIFLGQLKKTKIAHCYSSKALTCFGYNCC